MASKDSKVYMPMGTGGLLRYSEEEKEVIKLKPKHVIGIVIGVVLFELMLKFIF